MINQRINKKFKAFSLVEIVVAIGILGFIVSSVAIFAVDSYRNTRNAQYKVDAGFYTQEVFKAFEYLKNDNWGLIIDNTGVGTKHVELTGESYSLVDGTTEKNGVTVGIDIDTVYRDATGSIVESGGVEDLHTRKITITSSWVDILGNTVNDSVYFYINDWNVPVWVQSTLDEFDNGLVSDTITDNTGDGDGAVHLAYDTFAYADWCAPDLTLTSYDLPGSGIAKTIKAQPGVAHMGTGANASGISYAKVMISDDDPPVVDVPGTFDGYKTNSVYGMGDYAYLATDTNSEEVVIIDISQTPYQKVGYVDLPGNWDAESIYVVGDVGYVAQGYSFYTFDLSSKTGSRPLMDSFYLFNVGTHMVIAGDYAYVLLAAGAIRELVIIDISDPNNLQNSGYADVNVWVTMTSITVNEAMDRLYMGSEYSSTYDEIFIIDISEKTGQRPIIGSVDTNGMSVRDMAIVEDDSMLIAVGTGAEEYQVVNIEDESNPAYCGGLNVDSGINGIAAVVFADSGNRYAYVVSNDASDELKVIRGGLGGAPGGGGGTSDYYLSPGSYYSEVFDTGYDSADYFTLEWAGDLPAGTNLSMQMRTNTSSDMTGVSWFGPDGTTGSYFTSQSPTNIPDIANDRRYVQYKVEMSTSDINQTPLLDQVLITYSR